MRHVTNNNEETSALAQGLAKNLKGGDVIGLVGNLGAGKTVFSQGLARGLGVTDNVTSPTFVVMKVYQAHGHPSIKQLCHIDAYRLRGEADLQALGVDDYLGEPSTLTVIEWADKTPAILPEDAKIITIEIMDSRRNIKID